MRILLFTQQLAASRSGVGTYARGLVTGLVGRGHELTVVAPGSECTDLAGVGWHRVRSSRWDPSPGGWMTLGPRFAAAGRRLAEAHDIGLFTDAREAWRIRRMPIPHVGMVNDSYALDWQEPWYPRRSFSDRWSRGLYYRFLRLIERPTYRRMSALLANSDHVGNSLSKHYGVEESRIHVVRYGLEALPAAAPANLEGSPAILFVGGNFQRKGLPCLLEAVVRVRSTHAEARVHVVGQDRNQPALEARARELGVADRVVFHGRVPNDRVREMMAGANLFALPSWTEAFGLVYLEAMKASTPVIATSIGGAREVFEEGEEALFVGPGDSVGLAAAIRRVVEEPELADRLVAGGRAAVRRFSVEVMAEATEQVLVQVLEGR